MKRRNMWGNSIKKYIRVSTDCALLPTPDIVAPAYHPKPPLLPTPGTVEATQCASRPTTNSAPTTTHIHHPNNPHQNLHKNESSGEVEDMSPTETSPTASRYSTNLDEFLLSDSELPMKELSVQSQPDTLSDGSCSPSSRTVLSNANKNVQAPVLLIDRKRYQSGTGYDDILRIASENVKRQRRHSVQSEPQQVDNNSAAIKHRTRHSSSGRFKKKKLHESPRKLPHPLNLPHHVTETSSSSNEQVTVSNNSVCTETRSSNRSEQLIVSDEIQQQLDRTGKLTINLARVRVTEPEELKIVEKNVDTSRSVQEIPSERTSLFQSFSKSQLNVKEVDQIMDTSKTYKTNNIAAVHGSCKIPKGHAVDATKSAQIPTDTSSDDDRENVGLFERLRSSSVDISPSKEPQDNKNPSDSSSRDISPKKNFLSINLNLLKEKLMRKKREEDVASTSRLLDLPQTISTENDVQISDMDVAVNDVSDEVVDDCLANSNDGICCTVDENEQESTSQASKLAVSQQPVRPPPPTSHQASRQMNDSDDEDMFELISSDEDDLPEPSIFLGNTVKRSEQPGNTKYKEISFSQDSLNDSLFDNSVNEVDERPPASFKLSLDTMVKHKQDNKQKDDELAAITKELQQDVATGWMDRATLNDDDNSATEILPDHKKQLDKFSYPTDHVPDIYPGETVFNLDLLGEIFTFPSTLRLTDCGFVPVKGKATDSLLWKATPDDLVGLINSCLLVEAHLLRPCQDALMVWMFYLMSIHGSVHTIMQAFRTIWSLMNNSIKFNQGRIWLPTLKQVTRVLLNYGASFESMFPSPDLQPAFSLNDVINESGKGKENMVEEGTENSSKNASSLPKKQFPVVGLNHVIKVITHGMHLRDMHEKSVFYSEDELKQLIGIVCRAGLETQGKEHTHGEDFMLCTSSLLDGFSPNTWSLKCKELCQALPVLTNHHHNLVHLIDLFPTHTDRGRSIRRLLSYYSVHRLLSEDSAVTVKVEKEILTSEELKVFHLFPILRSLHPTSDTDFYRLHSIITLVDTCIGNEPLPAKEKDDLYKFIKELHSISSDIRASPHFPSRSKVKHVIQRVSIKFNIMADNMVTRQFAISKYGGSNIMDTPVEHLVNSKDDADSADDDDVVELKGFQSYVSISSDDSEVLISDDEDKS